MIARSFSLFPLSSTLPPEAMTMGKLHKDIGQLIVQSAEDPDKPNGQVVKVKFLIFGQFQCSGALLLKRL